MSTSIPGVIVIDDFFPDFNRVRQHALLSEYFDWVGPDNELYKRVALLRVPGLLAEMEKHLGAVVVHGAGYRLNYEGELPNQAIHSDLGYGTHALVVYLNEGDSGTAFWRHKDIGATEIDHQDGELFERIYNDFEKIDAWELVHTVPVKANRAVIYRGNMFHSRYPFEAFGTTPENARLIVVAFFSFPEAE